MSGEWTAEELAIFKQYHGRCIMCPAKAVTLHEIIPKSKRPRDWNEPGNRVPVCARCHRKIHDIGSKHFVDVLRSLQQSEIRPGSPNQD